MPETPLLHVFTEPSTDPIRFAVTGTNVAPRLRIGNPTAGGRPGRREAAQERGQNKPQAILRSERQVPEELETVRFAVVQETRHSPITRFSCRFHFINRGVYLACIIFHEDKVLVTTEDFPPVVEVDDTYPASVNNDFHWLMKAS